MNGKKKDYEAVVILPFIDEDRVLRTIEEQHCDERLTEKEKVRNSFEKEYLMGYSDSPCVFASALDRTYYPDIMESHCSILELENYEPVYTALAQAKPQDKTAVFSSIYPFCVGIRHSQSKQPEKKKKQLTDSVLSIIEVDFSSYPFINNAESLKALAKQYYGQFVQFGFPQCKIAQVTGFYTYEFGCECVPDLEKGEESIRPFLLHKDDKNHMKEVINEMKKLALQGVNENSYEVGSLDIGDNNIVVRLRPVYHFARRQSDGMVLPFFSQQYIYYPFCLTRPAKKLSITGGGLSITSMGEYTMKEGDEVVYIGKKKIGNLELQGHRGVVKEVKTTVLVEIEAAATEGVEGETNRTWVKEDDVKWQLKKEYQPLLHACLSHLYVKGQRENVVFSLNLSYGAKHLIREGLTRQQPSHKAARNVTLPARYYARLAVNTEERHEVNKEVTNVEYSPAAVDIIKEYFRRFGPVLAKNVTVKAMKPTIEKGMTEEKAREIRSWVQAQLEAYSFVSQDTISATMSFRSKLQNRRRGGRESEIGTISDVKVKVALECESKELLIHEPQYNIVSDAVLQQPMPSVGDAVVIVQHATIPFGARAIVTSVSLDSMWMEVLLDEPCLAGVSHESVVDASYCMGRVV